MCKFLQNRVVLIFLFFIFFMTPSHSQEINVCLWKGYNPVVALSNLANKFKGEFIVSKHAGQSLVINQIDLEEYLEGVLSKEMDSLWPLEALKAQAVLSRTFALHKMCENKSKNLPYDIENSIFHQVYGVTNCEKIKEAVYSTKGEVLTVNGEIAQIFFHANCGGATALPEEVWGGKCPSLKSVNDPYCARTPYYHWQKTFTKREISYCIGFPNLESVVISERGKSGRAKNLKFYSTNGRVMVLSAHKFRMAVNNKAPKILFTSPSVIPGTNFSVRMSGNNVVFTGTGYGHGVGMCQWGARKMAEEGKDYIEILKYYFQNFSLANYKQIDSLKK